MEEGIFYFLGTAPHHMIHARPVYRKLGGEFIVLSQEGKRLCEKENVPCRMPDEYPENTENYDLSKVANTIRYLNSQKGVIFFFQTFNIVSQLHSLKRIMLFHGNSLKDFWFADRKIPVLNKFDHIASLGPYRESVMLKKGVDPEKIVRIGMPRWDEIIRNAGATKNQELIFDKLGLKKKRIVTYVPTWWPPYSVEDLGKEIVKNISPDHILIFRPHPDTPAALIREYEVLIAKKHNVIYVPEGRFKEIDLTTLLAVSDIFIVDMSSIMTDIILTGKPMIFAFGEHKNRELYRESYAPTEERLAPIKEIFGKSEKIYMNNVDKINEIIGSASNVAIDPGARNAVKKRLFYNLEGDATEKLVEFVEGILK